MMTENLKISSGGKFLRILAAGFLAAASFPVSDISAKTFNEGEWTLTVDDVTGAADLSRCGRTLLKGSSARWGLDSVYTDFSACRSVRSSQSRNSDIYGDGSVVTVTGKDADHTVTRRFYLYPGKEFALTDFSVESPSGVSYNYMAPVWITGSYEAFSRPGNSVLFIPYDNDAWVRYRITPFGEPSPESYNVTALLNADTREALVVGAVEHDVWKTGVKTASQGPLAIDSLAVYGGAWSALTRDVRPHGAVSGRKVKSPKVMIGVFDDWRDGMETYGDLCATYAPRIASRGSRPFGWNSWGKLQTKVNFDNASQTGEFILDELQPAGFVNADSTVYVGLDAFWDFGLNDAQRKEFADLCHSRGQKAGIYYCPFTDWGKNPDATVGEAPQYKYSDLYLYSGDDILTFDGAYALDPTHPGTKARIARQLKEFIDWGYDFVKIDFMAHGAYEADRHYNPAVTTGTQAYNEGMAFIDSIADGKLWINLSIAPLLPANYAHSRRIGCDAWADINNTEYSLNALTYGWWLDHVYHYNDADHIVMEGVTDGENRARLTSSAITGLFLLGDDLSEGGDEATKARVRRTATNNDINEIARTCKSFRPVEPGKGDRAADSFYYVDPERGVMYVALFNFSDRSVSKEIPMHRLGLSDGEEFAATELWSHDPCTLHGTLATEIPSKDVKVYRIEMNK
ncbi:MAG: alpha-galactosidase [Bacteroidales bacterium]|nr:alpha-galactosidase [Bacteroidales bacterium]